MTDTFLDFVKEDKEAKLGATRDGFLMWLEEQVILNIDEFWNEYLDDLEFARNAELEAKLK